MPNPYGLSDSVYSQLQQRFPGQTITGVSGGSVGTPFNAGGGVSYSGTGAAPGIFGSRPAPIPMPTPYQNLSGVFPNLPGANATVSSDIMNELTGQLSPSVLNNIQQAAANFGITSGMPGSGLGQNNLLRNIGLTTEQLVQHGLGDYASLIPTIASTQTVSAPLQAEIAGTNASNAAAPDPTAVESYAENLFNKYMKKFGTNPAGGTASTTVPWYAQGQAGQYAGFNQNPYSVPGTLPGDFLTPPNLARGTAATATPW
jgi:hypothetical protein